MPEIEVSYDFSDEPSGWDNCEREIVGLMEVDLEDNSSDQSVSSSSESADDSLNDVCVFFR